MGKPDLKRNIYFGDKTVLLMSFLAAISFLSQLFANTVIISLCFTLSMVCVFVLFILRFESWRKMELMVVFALIIMAIAIVSDGIQGRFDYYKRAVIFAIVLMSMSILPYLKISKGTKQVVAIIFLLVAIFTIFQFFFTDLKEEYYGSTKSVTLNFDNPNEAGLWLMGIFALLFGWVFSEKKFICWLITLPVLILLAYIVYLTGARTSLISMLLMIVFFAFKSFFIKRHIPRWIIFVLVILPIIVFFLYMYVLIPNLNFFNSLFSGSGVDKTLTTRLRPWQKVLQDLKTCFLFGQYEEYVNVNVHNSLMSLYSMFGVFFLAFVCAIIFLVCIKTEKQHSVLSTLALLTILSTGCFETAVFNGASGFYLMLVLVPICVSENNVPGGISESAEK